MKIKLSQYAKQNNITYKTAYLWYKEGLIKEQIEVSPSGSIFIVINEHKPLNELPVYTYARVSSHNKRDDLNRQQYRCINFCLKNGYSITKNFKEVGSGMNDSRTQLMKLLEQPIGIIIIEHKDRLTRFGFNYLNKLYTKLGGKIIIINDDNISLDKSDLTKDLISVITSFCCKLYGIRIGYNKAKTIKNSIDSI